MRFSSYDCRRLAMACNFFCKESNSRAYGRICMFSMRNVFVQS